MSMHKSFRKFLSTKLDVPNARMEQLNEAKKLIRKHLRKHLPAALKHEFKDFTTEFTTPRFRTQGSCSHGTLNMPAHRCQHIDIDDGVYILIEYLKDRAEPRTCALNMFNAVQNALESLCLEKNWKLIRNIDTCVRIDMNDGAHVDIPIYAASANAYQTLEASRQAALSQQSFLEATNYYQDALYWGMLDSADVLLAHRSSGWIISDPGPVTKWVKQVIKQHGPMFVPMVRYIKAWRDWKWEKGGPSSICLMVAAERAFSPVQNRDDMTLLNTLATLPDMFMGKIPNPANQSEDLAAKLDKNGEREIVIKLMKALHRDLQQAIDSPEQASSLLKTCFGPRFPDIKQITPEIATAAVLTTPAQKVHRPIVKRSTSGHRHIVKRSHSG